MKAVEEYVHSGLTQAIIAAALEVHSALGPGFSVIIYEDALSYELRQRGIPFVRQMKVKVRYKEIYSGRQRLDMLVDGRVVVELKAVKALVEEHSAITMSYLKAVRVPVGLLINFGKKSLEVKRLFNKHAEVPDGPEGNGNQ